MVLTLAACTAASTEPNTPDTTVPDSTADSTPSLDTADKAVTTWKFIRGDEPESTDEAFEVQATWGACNGGVGPKDPQPVVKYSAETLTLTVWANTPEPGAHRCQANPWIPVTVNLTEPLGDRDVVAGPERPYGSG